MKKNKLFINFVVIFAVFIVLLYFFFDEENEDNTYPAEMDDFSVQTFNKTNAKIKWVTFDECPLPLQDPFALGLDSVVRENLDLFEKCKPSINMMSSLINGTLVILPMAGKCFYRCLVPKGEKSYGRQDWKLYTYSTGQYTRPACDFVEVKCVEGYKFGHHQIYIPRDEQKRPVTDKRPNVYIFGIDAISNQMFHRHLHRTAYFAEHEMAGVNFIHYNKVAKNSIPNQFPATFGKFRKGIRNPSEFDKETLSDFNSTYCKKKIPLDEQFISLVYNESGYRTARIFDDNMVHDISCTGFGRKIHDHGDYPFYSYFRDLLNLKTQMFQQSCRESAHYYFDHFMDYVKADSKKPKFMLHVVVKTGHDNPEHAASYDKYFHEGLRKNMDLFDDDFLIVWSDHGNHFGRIYDSAFGYKDSRNPLLTIIPPKRFRKEYSHPLYRNLLDNAKKLISHFDFYATLLDIATVNLDTEDFTQPLTPETALNRTNNRVKMLKGSSLLRPITRPNKCQAAHIPFHWCLCDYQHFIPDDEKDLIPILTDGLIRIIDKEIKEKRNGDEKLKEKRKVRVKEVAVKMKEEGKRLFHVKLFSPEFKSRKQFETFLELYKNGTILQVGFMDP